MRFKLLLLTIAISHFSFGQLGGSYNYAFLQLPSAARQAALGGNFISVSDADLNLAYSNPALLNELHHHHLALNYNSLFTGINYSNVAFAKHLDSLATFSANLQYFGYGEFIETDINGTELGSFNPNEFMVSLGASRAIDSLLTVGAHLNFLSSNLYTVNSFALALDLGAHYRIPKAQVSMGFVMKNIGVVVDDYSDDEKAEIPFEIQYGITKRLAKSPLRFTLTLENLQKWDLTYQDPSTLNQIDPLTGEIIPVEDPNFWDKLLLHTVFGSEILMGENLHLRFGYNYRRRQELRIEQKPGTAGFSWGFGMKINKFHINYGRGTYSLGQGTNHFSISTRFSYFNN